MGNRFTIPGKPRPIVQRSLYVVTAVGALAALFGFLQAYLWLPKSREATLGIVLVTIGLIAAVYGFIQAFRCISAWRIVIVRPWLAVLMTTGGMVSSAYGLLWAFRGIGMVSRSGTRVAAYILVSVGALAALFGFAMAFITVRKQSRLAKSVSSSTS